MPELILTIWIYFGACGFEVDDGSRLSEEKTLIEAPNIKGYWVRKDSVIGIVDWRTGRGLACTSIYATGAPHPVHVIGTTEEVIQKLRE